MPNERSLWRISPGQDRGLNDARSRRNLFSKEEKRQVPLSGAKFPRTATFARDNLLMFPFVVPLVGEGARERRCGLISNFAGLLIKTHRSTLTVMLARKCSFPKLHCPRYTLGGRVTYVRCPIFMAVPQFSADPATRTMRGTVALHLSFSREGENHAAEWIGINGGRVYRVSAMLPSGILRASLADYPNDWKNKPTRQCVRYAQAAR